MRAGRGSPRSSSTRMPRAGIGGALLARAAAALVAAERPTLGLAVTIGNPAQRLYESLGFATLQDIRQVVLPANVV